MPSLVCSVASGSAHSKTPLQFCVFRFYMEILSVASCGSKFHDDDSSMNQVVLMMTKSPKEWFLDWINKFKIKINFKIHEKKSRRFKIQEKLISRFKRRWIQDSREEIKKTSQGKYWKDFSKTKQSTILFYKRVFSKFSKLPEYLLSGNWLPVSCNRLPVIKFDFKSF